MFQPKCPTKAYGNPFATSFFQAQAKLVGESLHIQAAGTDGNREYGVAFDVEVGDEFAKWFAKFTKPCVQSLASIATYAPILCGVNGPDLTIQAVGPFGNMRSYHEVIVDAPSELLDSEKAECGCYKFSQ